MKDFAEINLEKENQISTPLRKGTEGESFFHFFHFFFHIFPQLLKGEENIYQTW